MTSLADDLVATGQLDRADTGRFVAVRIDDAALDCSFPMSLTTYQVIASAVG